MLVVCTVALAVGLIAVLLLNTVISQRAFRQHELEIELIYLAEKEEALARAVQQAESPLEVERAARKLGMVPAAAPIFLRLADGAVLGEPVPAPTPTGRVGLKGAPGLRPITPTPTASPEAVVPSPGASAEPGSAAIEPNADPGTLVEPLSVDPSAAAPAPVPRPEASTAAPPAASGPGDTP